MAKNFVKHNFVMLVTQGFAVYFPLSILLHKFTIILYTDTSLLESPWEQKQVSML